MKTDWKRMPRAAWRPVLAGLAASACVAGAQAADLAEQGKSIYTKGVEGVPACVTCHEAHAEGSAAANFPFLAGQGAAYLEEQLDHFADDSRSNPVMKPIASGLHPDQRKAVAAYVASLPLPWDQAALAGMAQTYPDADDKGAWLANRGDWSVQVPACTQCHAAGGIGVGERFPAIAGLTKAYIVEQFAMWRDGRRDGGPQNIMGDIAKRLSESQVDAVATYFSGLPEAAGKTQGEAKK